MITCPVCKNPIPDGEYANHIGSCRKMTCPECGQDVPVVKFVEHRNEHIRKMATDLGVKVPTPGEDEVARRAIAGGVVDKLTDFHRDVLAGKTPETDWRIVAGVVVNDYTTELLVSEYNSAKAEPTLMPKGMKDPIDFALSNFLPIVWSADQEFNGYADRKPEYQKDEFPTGSYQRDYEVVRYLVEGKDLDDQLAKARQELPLKIKEIEEAYAEGEKQAIIKATEAVEKVRKRKTLAESQRTAVNRRLGDLSGKYYDKIPLDDIFKAIRDNGGIVLQEDWTEWSGFLTGEDGKTTFDVGNPESKYTKDGLDFYNPYSNTVLVMTWHKMGSGRYEVVAYLS